MVAAHRRNKVAVKLEVMVEGGVSVPKVALLKIRQVQNKAYPLL